MKMIFAPNGEMITAILDKDSMLVNIPEDATVIDVDEITENKDLIIDIIRSLGVDLLGQSKYYLENGVIIRRDDWTPV